MAEEDAQFRDVGAEATKRLLKEHPDTNMIWAWNQAALLGCIDALKELERSDIVVMGTDMSMELADDMLEDQVNLQAVTTQLPYNMGYKAVVNAVDTVNGKKIEKSVLIPLSTYTKSETERIQEYIENHKDLVQE